MALREPPPYVVSAIEADDRYRRETEQAWDRYLETRPAPARKLSQADELTAANAELEALVTSGLIDVCPRCGVRVVRHDGIFSCAACGVGWDAS
jgi:hypothetical protein